MGVLQVINKVRHDFEASRDASVKERLTANWENLKTQNAWHLELASSRGNGYSGILSARMNSPQLKINGWKRGCAIEIVPSTFVKLPDVKKIPRFTTRTHLARNQMMSEEESLIDKNMNLLEEDQIQDGGTAEPQQYKYEFTAVDDQILLVLDKEYGLTDHVCKVLKRQFLGASVSEIQERCKMLKVQENGSEQKKNRTAMALKTI